MKRDSGEEHFVTILVAGDEHKLAVAKHVLQQDGIPYVAYGDPYGHFGFSDPTDMRLRVPRSFAKRAKKLLARGDFGSAA
jgi:hypothetical protein